jgi:hypothetical protein
MGLKEEFNACRDHFAKIDFSKKVCHLLAMILLYFVFLFFQFARAVAFLSQC